MLRSLNLVEKTADLVDVDAGAQPQVKRVHTEGRRRSRGLFKADDAGGATTRPSLAARDGLNQLRPPTQLRSVQSPRSARLHPCPGRHKMQSRWPSACVSPSICTRQARS